MIWPTYIPNFRGPRPLPKPAKSPTSTPMKPSTSRRPTTSTPSLWSFSRRRARLQGPTRRGSVPFSQRKRISTPNHRLLIQFIIIICLLPVILTDSYIKSTSDFHLVFEEIGLMASSTNYQLATMKGQANATRKHCLRFQNNYHRTKRVHRENSSAHIPTT
jgi:hypothetical protein